MAKRITILLFLAVMLLSLGYQTATAQDEDHSYKPLSVKLDDSGNKYIRFIVWHQMWATTNNLDIEDSKLTVTPSIRRSRFLAYAQVSPKFLILTHFGLNGLSTSNLTALGNRTGDDAAQLFLHDAWTEYKVFDELYIGAGLHYWKGLTRLASQSTLNFMTLDQSRPFVHWHSLGITDQFARHLGVYAKGAIGKFDYRLAVNSPGLNNPLGGGRSYSTPADTLQILTYTGASTPDNNGDPLGRTIIEGYFRYNLWDTESTKLPYIVGTYFDKKKVLALGAGFFAHPNGMYNSRDLAHEDVFHFAVDAFLNLPTPKGALTAYASFMNFQYGSSDLELAGLNAGLSDNYTSRWAGTGNVIYGHAGYYVKPLSIMPYVSYQTSSYDGFDDAPSALDIGVNYLINGHHAKITLEYHYVSDPREGGFDANGDVQTVSQIRLQGHISL